MLGLINQERSSRGLNPLQLEQNLNDSAEDHSEWMLARDVFSHTGASGSSATQRMRAADFDFAGSWRSAENIAVQSERGAAGITDDVRDLHNSLMASPGHRANLLNPDLKYIGIGIERGDFVFGSGRGYDSVIVTQNFAATQGSVDLDRGTAPPPPPPTGPAAITGTGGADRLVGTLASDVINAYGGNDRIYGRAGNDIINAGDGNDRVYASIGNDRVTLGNGNDFVSVGGGAEVFYGGAGRDTISYFASTGGVALNLQTGGSSGSWAQTDRMSGFENATGSNTGGDRLYGTSGSNTLKGYGGNDLIYGRAGNDVLAGGAGRDRLDGDEGNDVLYGGGGADVFHFDRGDDRDTIRDFQDNVDTIQLDNFAFRSVSQALSSARQSGSDVIFELGGGDQLRVEDIRISQLANDLVLV
jgi:Ca2+-binding RTX toxin-like protein